MRVSDWISDYTHDQILLAMEAYRVCCELLSSTHPCVTFPIPCGDGDFYDTAEISISPYKSTYGRKLYRLRLYKSLGV